MKRSRLKNIINKSKPISNKQEVGNPFDEFKKSLPIEVDDNYRLEAAWKAYGSPKDFKSALWYGLIQPIDENNYKLPSIGYNEETDEYEYLNKGKENDTVAKDIRVWDNDVIPFVQELKLGGYVRIFNEEKDCWTYSKNKPQENLEINSFLKGGKPKERKYKTYEEFKNYLGDRGSEKDYDLKGAYNDDEVYFNWENEESKNPGNGHFSDKYKLPNHPTFSIHSKYSNSIIPGGTWELDEKGNWSFRTSPWIESQHSLENLRQYFLNNEPGVTLIYKNVPYFTPQAFKLGGAVIPSGSLHARKNHMQLASEGLVTPKGIPVISEENGEIQLLAEIERNEVIFDKLATTDIEKLYKKFNETDKLSEKDEIAIKAGKIITDIFINNTEDNTGLIEKVAEKNNLEYNK